MNYTFVIDDIMYEDETEYIYPDRIFPLLDEELKEEFSSL